VTGTEQLGSSSDGEKAPNQRLHMDSAALRQLSATFGGCVYTMNQYFTGANTWDGGYYELALELGHRSDDLLLAALIALWTHPNLDGVYLSRDQEPLQQRRQAVTTESLQVMDLQGLAAEPNAATVACGTWGIREDDGPDWLDLYLPRGALAAAYDVGRYPFEPDVANSRHWREPLDAWLARIGAAVYERVPYRLGLVGFEVSGEVHADEIARTGVPARRYAGFLWPESGTVRYDPSTE